MAQPLIALLTDFGQADWYVACMKGVILSRCPTARLVDITHEIPPQDITAGAVILAAAVPWFPPQTVFACVVDPGVGTRRALIAAQADHHLLVGPDNGLLSLVLQRAKRVSVVRLTKPRYWLPTIHSASRNVFNAPWEMTRVGPPSGTPGMPGGGHGLSSRAARVIEKRPRPWAGSFLNRTFHGRDIIAPVAAHLACRRPLPRLGASTTTYQTLAFPAPQRRAGTLEGRILHIDAFGNLITNFPSDISLREMSESGKSPNHKSEPKLQDGSRPFRYHGVRVRLVSSYQEGRAGELIAVAGSTGYVELAIRNGSAAARYRAKRGDRVHVTLSRRGVR